MHSLVNQWYSFSQETQDECLILSLYLLIVKKWSIPGFKHIWWVLIHWLYCYYWRRSNSFIFGRWKPLQVGSGSFFFVFCFGLEFIIVICGKVRSNRSYLYTSDVGLHYVHSKSYMIKRRLEKIRGLSHGISNLSPFLSVSLLRDWMSRVRQ